MSNETTKIDFYPMRKSDPDYQDMMGLVYGASGSGKSTLACGSVATLNQVPVQEIGGKKIISKGLVCDAEIGMTGVPKKVRPTVITKDFNPTTQVKTLITKPIETYPEFVDMYEFLRKHHVLRNNGDLKGIKILQDKYFGIVVDELWFFDVLIVDSLTVLQNLCFYYLKKIDIKSVDLRVAPPKSDFTAYANALDLLIILLQSLRALPIHQLHCVQEEYIQDETGKMIFNPMLVGSIKTKVTSPYDIVMRLTTDVTKDGIIVREGFMLPIKGQFVAKHRLPSFRGHKLPMNEVKDPHGNVIQPRLPLTFDTLVKLRNEEI